MILGAGGKMGPTLAQRLLQAHCTKLPIGIREFLQVRDFRDPTQSASCSESGVQTILSCDLLDQ